MVLNNHSQQQNVATNLHSVVYEILINRYTLQAGTVLSPSVVEYCFDRGIETKTTRQYYPIYSLNNHTQQLELPKSSLI